MTDVQVDLLVVGAGPVGLGTALLARRAGLSVCVVDRRDDPVDKACGEGLMPGALAALLALGVDPPGQPFHGIRYLTADGRRSAAARFSHGPGRGVRRTALHAALTGAAAAAGVLRRTALVDQVEQDGRGVRAAGIRARYLAAADGLHSPVRRSLGLDLPRTGPARYGLRQHYRVPPWSDLVEVHWADAGEAYVTPVGPDEVGVAILGPGGRPYPDLLARFPVLHRRLAGAEATSTTRGAGPLEQNVAGRVRGRVLLVGDAAGYVDALTGEGVAVGLQQAAALVRCVVADRPQDFEAEWRAATRRYRMLTRAVLVAATHRPLRRALVPAAAALPPVFALAVNALA